MDAVVVEAEADHQAVHAENRLEMTDHRNGAAGADERRRLAPLRLQRGARLAHGGAVEGKVNCRAATVLAELDLGVGRQPIRHILAEGGANLVRVLSGDEAEGDLGFRRGRKHRLEAGAGIAAGKAVDLAGRARPDLLEHGAVDLAGRRRQAGAAEEGGSVEAEAVPIGAQFRRDVGDAVIKAGNRDTSLVVVQAAEYFRQYMQRIECRAAEGARVEVVAGATQGNLLADQSAQHGGDGRRLAIPHLGVADERHIDGQFVLVSLEEGKHRGRARFLFPLGEEGDVDRQRACLGDQGSAGFQEGHQLAFVVLCATGEDALAAVGECLHHRLEGRRVPKLQRIDRLHVVMGVEQHMGLVRAGLSVMADHHRMLGRRPYGRIEPERGQLIHQPGRCACALVLVGWIGGNRGDAQEIEQAVEAFGKVGIDAG